MNRLDILSENLFKDGVEEYMKEIGIMRDCELIIEEIYLFEKKNFLNKDQCDLLIKKIREDNFESGVIGENKNYRKSKTSYLVKELWLDKLLNDYFGSRHGEGIQGTMYNDDDFFKLHHDWFLESNEQGGQRTWTVLIYLNNMSNESGKTVFPKYNKCIRPEMGKLICWYNLDKNGDGNYDTNHIAEIVNGEKYIIQKWFRPG